MQRQFTNVAIPLETTARELNSKLMLSTALARKGFTVYFGTKDFILDASVRMGNVIYLDKGFHRGTSELVYRQLKQAGCLVASLDEENGVDFRDFHMLDNRMPDDFLPQMDLILLWGVAQDAHLRAKRKQYDPDRIRITGHPRFDLLKPYYHSLYREKVDGIRRKYGEFILFNTNSKYSNNINGREAVIRNYGSRVRGLDERLAYDDQRLALNIALIRRLATEIGKTVVVRPHPEENIEVYRRTFADMPNVHAVYEDSAHYWILAAELMIHNHSTTGLEAAMLGHASIAYTPIPTEENFCPWIPIACSHRVEHEDEAVAFVANRDWQQPPPSLAGILHDFFSYDRDATPQVIDAISELAGRRLHEGASGSLMPMVWRRRLSYWKQQLLGRETLSPLNRNKLQELKPSIVGERYKTIVGAMPAGNPTAFTALHPHLYRVTPAS